MKESVERILQNLLARYPALIGCEESIRECYALLEDCYRQGGKLLLCGNGGSQSDTDHIVGELMKGFLQKRPLPDSLKARLDAAFPEGESPAKKLQCGLPAISLGAHTGLCTAFCNDVDPDLVFAQQVLGYGRPGDVLLGLSTSGNSKNVVAAVRTASALGLKTLSVCGETGGKLRDLCDVTVCLPAKETYLIQEYTLPLYHALCAMLEEGFFGV